MDVNGTFGEPDTGIPGTQRLYFFQNVFEYAKYFGYIGYKDSFGTYEKN